MGSLRNTTIKYALFIMCLASRMTNQEWDETLSARRRLVKQASCKTLSHRHHQYQVSYFGDNGRFFEKPSSCEGGNTDIFLQV
jgi:hypothetical protein